MIADAFEHVDEVAPGVELGLVAGGDEALQDGCGLAAGVAAEEGPVAAAHGHTAQAALGGIVVDRQGAVVGIEFERFPVVQRVGDRPGFDTLGQHVVPCAQEKFLELRQHGLGIALAQRQTLFRAQPAGLALHAIQQDDVGQRRRHLRQAARARFIEFATRVRPAAQLHQAAVRLLEKGIVASIGVGLQIPAVVLQELLGTFALPAGGVVVDGGVFAT